MNQINELNDYIMMSNAPSSELSSALLGGLQGLNFQGLNLEQLDTNVDKMCMGSMRAMHREVEEVFDVTVGREDVYARMADRIDHHLQHFFEDNGTHYINLYFEDAMQDAVESLRSPGLLQSR